MSDGEEMRIGQQALFFAQCELGEGEQGSNNRGASIRMYRSAVPKPGPRGGSWCSHFISWTLARAAAYMGIPVGFDLHRGARRLFRNAVAAGQFIPPAGTPEPGDLVCWKRWGWRAHIGTVSRVDACGNWLYIAGNEGTFPAVTRERSSRTRNAKKLIGFARV